MHKMITLFSKILSNNYFFGANFFLRLTNKKKNFVLNFLPPDPKKTQGTQPGWGHSPGRIRLGVPTYLVQGLPTTWHRLATAKKATLFTKN